ncbi:MAG: L-histidine N(alpha)-methyltransferase [Burkholderiales bacterium]|nr:L-histidine N(alpha)-methyltransferase [Burkholderiales bacterium]
MNDGVAPTGRFDFVDLAPPPALFLDEVMNGLGKSPKALPAKYFYDPRGSQLFEAICALPEYYPTRTETALMTQYGGAMAAGLGESVLLIEYGSGSGEKTRILIDALNPAAYMPIDISESALLAFAGSLAKTHPKLPVIAICADYARPLSFPNLTATEYRRKAVYFPGSTIGNFTREESLAFLRQTRDLLGSHGAMLVGVDLKKDPAVLHAAYNDTQGVTAEFNLNILAHINRVLDADFDLGGFWHYAFYAAPLGRIEMHLVSKKAQAVNVAGRQFFFREGEAIHTEISCKYEVEEFQALAVRAGFQASQVWMDDDRLFAVHLLTVL